MSDPVTREPNTSRVGLLRDPATDTGRLWVLALMGGVAGALPLPAIPTVLLRRVRGAAVHEASSRHSLALTADARAWLSDPSKTVRRGAFLATAAFVAKRALRRLGALGVVPPVLAWFEVYTLGLLFERYLTAFRQSQTLRIDLHEARAVRMAIDQASALVLSAGLRSVHENRRATNEDLRDLPTRVSDTVLIGLASGPSYLKHRLETAFDQTMEEQRGSENV